MGYLYVFKDGKTDEKITLGSIERRKEFRILVEEFKNIMNRLSFERINAEDVKICGLDQDFLKAKYSIDSGGCSRLTYKDVLTLLNNINIKADSLAASASADVAPAPKSATGAVSKASTGSIAKTSTGAASAKAATLPKAASGAVSDSSSEARSFE
jgi:hypothetical protein